MESLGWDDGVSRNHISNNALHFDYVPRLYASN